MDMSKVQMFFNKAWNACPSRAEMCPDSQTPARIATYVKDTFKSMSFDSVKNSKWTYVVLASTVFIAGIYKIYKLREENNSLKTAADAQKKSFKLVKASLENMETSVPEKNEIIAQLHADAAEKDETITQLQTELKIVRNANKRDLVKEVERLKAEIKEKEGLFDEELEKGVSEKLQLQHLIKIQELELEKLQELERSKLTLEKELSEKQELITTQRSTSESQIQTLQDKVKKLEDQIEGFKNQQALAMVNHKTDKERNGSELALKQEIDQLKEKINQMEAAEATKITKRASENSGLELQISQLREKLATANSEKEEMEKQQSAMKADKEKISAELKNLGAKLKETETQNASLVREKEAALLSARKDTKDTEIQTEADEKQPVVVDASVQALLDYLKEHEIHKSKTKISDKLADILNRIKNFLTK